MKGQHFIVLRKLFVAKDAGWLVDKSLTFGSQINSVCSNITRRITLLKLLSKYIDKTNLNQYYTEEVTKSGSLLPLGKNSVLSKTGDQRCDRKYYL